MIGLFNPFFNLGVRYPSIATPSVKVPTISPNVKLPGGFSYNTSPGPVAPTSPGMVPKSTIPIQYPPLPPIQWGTTPTFPTLAPVIPNNAQGVPDATLLPKGWATPTNTTPIWMQTPAAKPQTPITPTKAPVIAAKTK